MCNNDFVGITQQKEKCIMSREEYQLLFNELIRDIAQLLEVSGNEMLIRAVKKKLYNFSDELLKGEVLNEESNK